jgi:hypothetical protein
VTARLGVRVEQLGTLVPGPAAAGVACLRSNNNLDLAVFRDRLYLAWRTAKNHFAGTSSRIEVSSAPFPLDRSATRAEGTAWRHETTFAVGSDLREPRLAVDGQRLHLFCMQLGTDPKRFQPRRTWHLARDGERWEGPVVAIEEAVVPWRVRRLYGRWALSTYRGAEKVYGPFPADPVVELRFSDDLVTWSEPLVVHHGGIEAELVERNGGGYLGITRNEGPSRAGSDLLTGNDLASLDATPIDRKLDSPNLFLWEGEPWLIARRSLAFGGRYGLAPTWLPGALRMRVNQGAWWVTRKRSALYRVDAERRAIGWVADLPSRGDTSFAGVVEEPEGSLLVADYTSPAGTGDPVWMRGQLQPTEIQLLRVRREEA